MRYTKTRATISLVDTTATEDGVYTSTDVNQYADLSNLDIDGLELNNYATCEQDQFLLGSPTGTGQRLFSMYEDMEQGDLAYWSDSMADENGYFVTNPTITREFTNSHSSSAITLVFDKAYPLPKKIRISLFGLLNRSIDSRVFTISTYKQICDISGVDYHKIIVEFIQVEPYNYARLKQILYGQEIDYAEGAERDLAKASVTEQISMISEEVAINTSTLKVIDPDSLFSITNPQSYYQYLQERQKISIYEDVLEEDGTFNEYVMAVHYLKEWSTENDVVSTFTCQDILGLMDGGQYKGNLFVNATVSDIVEDIMDDFGFTDYYITQNLASMTLSGVIAPCTHRQALQQVVFACGGVIDTSRISGIMIYKTSHATSSMVLKDRIFMSPKYKITQTDYVSGVEVTTHSYSRESAKSQAYKGALQAGTYDLSFNEPFDTLSGTNCTVNSSGYYWANVTVASTAEVTLEGYKYVDSTSTFSVQAEDMPGDVHRNVKKVTNATLVSRSNVQELARHLYNYYQYRLQHELKIICKNEKAGNFSTFQLNGLASGVINSLTIDLTGGFLAQVKAIGFALKQGDEEGYAQQVGGGYELYSGDELGVI